MCGRGVEVITFLVSVATSPHSSRPAEIDPRLTVVLLLTVPFQGDRDSPRSFHAATSSKVVLFYTMLYHDALVAHTVSHHMLCMTQY
jgi:hypothetical protein